MEFDTNNPVVKLCAQGMEHEGEGKKEEAVKLFMQAWNQATTDFEKFTAAHYVARHQKSVEEKLKWDELALHCALNLKDENYKGTYPSLYLNVAKCYEDLRDFENARKNYEAALSFAEFLPVDGYGNLIRNGIKNGLERVT